MKNKKDHFSLIIQRFYLTKKLLWFFKITSTLNLITTPVGIFSNVFCFASATDVVNTCKGYLARALIISALADEGIMMWLKKMTSTLGHGPLELKNI